MSRPGGMGTLTPRLDILPPAQRALWSELGATPPQFTLYGGIALQLGHRQSVDCDFFSNTAFEPDNFFEQIPYLARGEVTQRAEGTLTVRVDRDGPVLLSYYHTPRTKPFGAILKTDDIGLQVASLIDLAGLKADVVQKRAHAKDFIDVDALITHGISLLDALAVAKIIRGEMFSPEITLKALTYFGDGDLDALSASVRARLKRAVSAVDLNNLASAIYALKNAIGKKT